ncbi:MAG: histidine phosphatase family protein [Gammaproteobacteria bacterium]|nr:histidine phosphatase family protein [Gammaproteobacteria bacterium]
MRETEDSTQLLFVRHGTPDFPGKRIYCDGKEDPALNEKGLKEAQATAQLLKGCDASALYSSPLKRSQMTAAEIAKKTGLAIITHEKLKERNFGIWEGLYFDEIENNFPEDYKRWKQSPACFNPKGGESIHDMNHRIQQAINEIITENYGKKVIVACHVGPIRVALTQAMKMPVEHYRQLRIDCASISRIDYGATQNNFIYMNVTAEIEL